MSYQRNQIEEALATAFEIQPERRGAFRAQLQYLRRLGIPSVDNPGTGYRVEYKIQHVVQLIVALSLQTAGFEPMKAAETLRKILDDHFMGLLVQTTFTGSTVVDFWIHVIPGLEGPRIKRFGGSKRDHLLADVEKAAQEDPGFIFINLSRHARTVMRVLKETEPATRG